MDTYRVKVDDLEYPAEFANLPNTQAFANGARFVLDNLSHRHYQQAKVTITTYANVYDADTDSDTITEIHTREV